MLYINKTIELLVIAVLPILVQSAYVQGFNSKIPQQKSLKYDHSFHASNQLQCSYFSQGDYSYFENNTCYTARYPMKSGNREINGRYFVNVKGICLKLGRRWLNDACVWTPSPNNFNWTNARQHCEKEYGSLITAKVFGLQTVEELMDYFRAVGGIGSLWIGVNDREIRGKWKWVDGGSVSTDGSGWYPGQPKYNDENCGLVTGYKLHDYPCKKLHHFKCIFTLNTL